MKTNRPGGLALTREALSACCFSPGDLVLDAGCGYGATVDFINQSKGIRVLGLDMDLSRLIQARAKALGTGTMKNRAVAAKLPHLPFGPGRFQGIFCECVLSLVPEKACCLAEFFKALAPGGVLVIADLVLPDGIERAGIGPPLSGRPVTCLDGALTLAALTHEVDRAGFCITRVEDHTRMLREMACQMVFEHGSLDRFWQVLTGTDFPAGLTGACRAGNLKPGYALVMARKGK